MGSILTPTHPFVSLTSPGITGQSRREND
ncbi:hypothetical protein LINPERPRIM_LOCUS21796 [Linum perenne]